MYHYSKVQYICIADLQDSYCTAFLYTGHINSSISLGLYALVDHMGHGSFNGQVWTTHETPSGHEAPGHEAARHTLPKSSPHIAHGRPASYSPHWNQSLMAW
jgi:hypothetical protein